MKCSKCGYELFPSDKVCSVCGTAVDNSAAKPAGIPVPVKSRSKAKPVIIGVSIGLLCILLAAGGIFFFKPDIFTGIFANSSKEDDTTPKVDGHVHDFVDGICSICGNEDPDYTPHVHDYVATVTEPTCTEDGYTTYKCSCGDEYTDDKTSAAGHTYTSAVTEPTCTEDGYTTYTCSACGDEYKDEYVDATGHTYEDSVCTVCGEEEVVEETDTTDADDTADADDKTNTPNDSIPKTGESNAPIFFVIVLVFSLIGVAYSIYLCVILPKKNT